MRPERVFSLILCLLVLPVAAGAQDLPRRTVEVSGGFAGFIDESIIPHGTIGAAVRWDLGRHVSFGPEVVFMKGEGNDDDLFLTGKFVFDFRRDRQVSPYAVVDGGMMIHHGTFVGAPAFWAKEGALSFGGGVRINGPGGIFVAPEVRIGWEPHIRYTLSVGWRR